MHVAPCVIVDAHLSFGAHKQSKIRRVAITSIRINVFIFFWKNERFNLIVVKAEAHFVQTLDPFY